LLCLLVLGAAGGQAAAAPVPLAPAGVASAEGVEVFLAPPGPWTIGGYGLSFSYRTSGGASGQTGEVEIGTSPLLADVGVRSTRTGVQRMLLTSGQADYASVDGGPPIALQPAVSPPYELRAALFEVPGITQRQLNERKVRLTIRLLDAGGGPLPEAPPATSAAEPAGPNPALETRSWVAPLRPARGVCSIRAARTPGLRALSGSVVSVLRPLRGVVGRRWLTCATTVYSYRGGPQLQAWVLLDAAHPGATPEDIPSMVPMAGHAGYFESLPGGGAEPFARRIRHGWLLVQGGETAAQALSALEHLRAAVAR
jgi:hypothetical protein